MTTLADRRHAVADHFGDRYGRTAAIALYPSLCYMSLSELDDLLERIDRGDDLKEIARDIFRNAIKCQRPLL